MERVMVSVAETKRNFSEFVNRSAFGECRVVITKRNKPVAAIVSMRDLNVIERAGARKGLLAAVGKWEGFEEIAGFIEEAVKSRSQRTSSNRSHRLNS